ncbi:MAG: hypothetical protein EOO37_03845 [Cytophagaceae bacterium]|nr:MAG: hypothetical protein EOO37_03845 [Cytophagaceae bacterium]
MGTAQVLLLLFILAIIVVASSGHTALEISEDLRRFRKYYAVIGYKIGDWRAMPTVVGVTIKYFSTATRGNSKYGWEAPINRLEEVIVMLSVRNSSEGFIIGRFSVDDVNEAIDLAHNTAERFQVAINTYLPSHLFKAL